LIKAVYLGESENVVNEKEHILSLLISEVFSNSKSGQSNSGTGTWGLVHLSVDKGYLGLSLQLDNTSLNHLVVKIVTLTSSLSYTREHGVPSVSFGYVVDQFHNKYSFSYSSTTEKTCNDLLC